MNTNHSTSQQTASTGAATTKPQSSPENKSREHSGLYYSTQIKITDPQTGAVLLHTRGE